VAGTYSIQDLLALIIRQRAEELYLQSDHPPFILLHGEKVPVDTDETTMDNVMELLRGMATADHLQEFDRCGDVRFTYVFQNSRFSVNVTRNESDLFLKIKSLSF
jgi:Tfp pilus assembly ATPase PilU